MAHKYRTEFSPAAYMASLKTWEHRFNANVQFIDRQFSEYYILSTFTYYAREALKQRPLPQNVRGVGNVYPRQ